MECSYRFFLPCVFSKFEQIVPCRAGTGKSGVFVAINQLIERLNSENVVNVFKTVRKLRQGRTAIVQTLVSEI